MRAQQRLGRAASLDLAHVSLSLSLTLTDRQDAVQVGQSVTPSHTSHTLRQSVFLLPNHHYRL